MGASVWHNAETVLAFERLADGQARALVDLNRRQADAIAALVAALQEPATAGSPNQRQKVRRRRFWPLLGSNLPVSSEPRPLSGA